MRRQAGFTILELVVVMGVVSVLMGIGIGFLGQGGDKVMRSWSMLRDQLRLAGETARREARPTELRLMTPQDSAVVLQARVLRAIGVWHLEPAETAVAGGRQRAFRGLVGELGGIAERRGRFGYGRRPGPNPQNALVRCEFGPRVDLGEGFAFRIEVFLEERQRCTVVKLTDTFLLTLDNDLRPEAKVVLRAGGDRVGNRVTLTSKDTLPLKRWVSLELIHDGTFAMLLVDGLEVSRQDAKGEPFQTKQNRLLVSPPDAPVRGVVDEVQLAAYEVGEPLTLPIGATFSGLPAIVRFNRRGELMPPARPGTTIQLDVDGETETRSLAPGGLLR